MMTEKSLKFWQSVTEKMKTIWGNNLLQIAVYNRHLSEKGNLVIVLQDDSIEQIVLIHHLVKEIIKNGFEPPLVVSPSYTENSLDSFPLEFLNIKSDYQNLHHTRDIFGTLTFEKGYIRLEIERELKSKILLIKMAILDNYGKVKILRELIKASVQSIEPIMKGLLFLLDQEIPLTHTDLINKADEVTDFDIGTILTAVNFTIGETKIEKEALSDFFSQYTSQLFTLSHYIEQLKI